MPISSLRSLLVLVGGVVVLAPGRLVAQRLPARSQAIDLTGTDSATQHPITIHLTGKAVGPRGRQYAGACSIRPAAGRATASALAGEWQLTQKSAPGLATGAAPAIAGLGVRAGATPPKPGQQPTAAGQVIDFTIQPRPDGRYEVLLLDAFSEESLEFVTSAAK